MCIYLCVCVCVSFPKIIFFLIVLKKIMRYYLNTFIKKIWHLAHFGDIFFLLNLVFSIGGDIDFVIIWVLLDLSDSGGGGGLSFSLWKSGWKRKEHVDNF